MNKVEATEYLEKFLAQGGKVYAIIRHVARSGMSRNIGFVGFKPGDADPYHLTYRMSVAMGVKCHTIKGYDVLRVQGAGMDMAWHTVSRAFGDKVANDRSKYGGIL